MYLVLYLYYSPTLRSLPFSTLKWHHSRPGLVWTSAMVRKISSNVSATRNHGCGPTTGSQHTRRFEGQDLPLQSGQHTYLTLSTSWDRDQNKQASVNPRLYLLPLCGRAEAAKAGLRELSPVVSTSWMTAPKHRLGPSRPQANNLESGMRSN